MSGHGQRQQLRAQRGEALRDRIRRECLARVQAQRSELLTRLRRGRSQDGVQPSLAGIIRDVVSLPDMELGYIRDVVSLPDAKLGNSPDDMDSSGATDHATGSFQGQAGAPMSHRRGDVGGPEYEELMAELEAALFEDDPAAQAEYLDSLDAEERENIAQAFLETCMSGPGRPGSADSGASAPDGSDQPVICPVCQQAYLVQTAAGVGCPRDGFWLAGPSDGLRLSDLRSGLASAYKAHAAGGCVARPGFMVSNEFTGVWTLFITCDCCHAFDVVF